MWMRSAGPSDGRRLWEPLVALAWCKLTPVPSRRSVLRGEPRGAVPRAVQACLSDRNTLPDTLPTPPTSLAGGAVGTHAALSCPAHAEPLRSGILCSPRDLRSLFSRTRLWPLHAPPH